VLIEMQRSDEMNCHLVFFINRNILNSLCQATVGSPLVAILSS
jgi:hypothetical protein